MGNPPPSAHQLLVGESRCLPSSVYMSLCPPQLTFDRLFTGEPCQFLHPEGGSDSPLIQLHKQISYLFCFVLTRQSFCPPIRAGHKGRVVFSSPRLFVWGDFILPPGWSQALKEGKRGRHMVSSVSWVKRTQTKVPLFSCRTWCQTREESSPRSIAPPKWSPLSQTRRKHSIKSILYKSRGLDHISKSSLLFWMQLWLDSHLHAFADCKDYIWSRQSKWESIACHITQIKIYLSLRFRTCIFA